MHVLLRDAGATYPTGHSVQLSAFMIDENVPAGQYLHDAVSCGAVSLAVGGGGGGGAGGGGASTAGGGDGGCPVHGGGDGGGDGGGAGAGGGFGEAGWRVIVSVYRSIFCPFGAVVVS